MISAGGKHREAGSVNPGGLAVVRVTCKEGQRQVHAG